MTISLIPVQLNVTSENKVDIQAMQNGFVRTTFSEIKLANSSGVAVTIHESDLEELVRKNADLLSSGMGEDGPSLLIIGQQTVNAAGGKADLVAIDGSGSIVLIELKRDAKDAQQRAEPMELQAIRYAASFAKIKTKVEIIDLLFTPYVKKHFEEFKNPERAGLSERQIAEEQLNLFLSKNNIEEQDINQSQRVVLLASGFEEQTLSACAWLSKNNVDISCLEIYPMLFKDGYLIAVEQKIPPPELDDFLVGIPQSKSGKSASKGGNKLERALLPKMPKLFEWGIVKVGDKIIITKKPEQVAELLDENRVKFQNTEMPINAWAKKVTGWSAVNIYEWIEVVGTGKTLDELRREKLASLEEAASQQAASEDSATSGKTVG